MTRPDDPSTSRSPSDERFWRALAVAEGFEQELGDDDATDFDEDAALSAVRLVDLVAEDRESLASESVDLPSRRGLLLTPTVLTAVALATAACVAVAVSWQFFAPNPSALGPSPRELASAEALLAEEWAATRQAYETDADAAFMLAAIEEDDDVVAAAEENGADAGSDFDEAPDWLVLAVQRRAETDSLSPESTVEEATR